MTLKFDKQSTTPANSVQLKYLLNLLREPNGPNDPKVWCEIHPFIFSEP